MVTQPTSKGRLRAGQGHPRCRSVSEHFRSFAAALTALASWAEAALPERPWSAVVAHPSPPVSARKPSLQTPND
jgi:hypothetical protein